MSFIRGLANEHLLLPTGKKITFNICPYKSFPNIANSSIIQRIKEVILIDPHCKTANHK